MVRKYLVAVTGMSPQIVTETLYALVVKQQWVPDEVHVLTTQTGKQRLVDTLWGEKAHLARFFAEYGVQDVQFSPDHIHLITDEAGRALADIRTPEQNNWAADRIVRFIHDLCLQDESELHVSIAGGRKSMGFYIGYALSLFGRRQDRLSHVLVNEPFENHPDFFYPTREDCWIDAAQGRVNAKTAEVMLADIPFVRMRGGMPKMALADGDSYLQAVQQTQLQLADWHLLIDVQKRVIRCGQSREIHLKPQHFALYAAMAELKRAGVAIRKDSSDDMALLLQYFWRFYGEGRWEEDKARLADRDFAEMRRILQEGSSVISRMLKKALGDYAMFFKIGSKGKNNGKRYALATDVAQIHWLGRE